MASLKRVKSGSVDIKTKNLVFGWIRNVDALIKSNNIPMAIYYLCLAYYYFPEYFHKAREDRFKISDDKLTITCFKNCSYLHHTIYMKYIIKSMKDNIIKWVFKINEHPANGCKIYFGIVCGYSEDALTSDCTSHHEPHYFVSNKGYKYYSHGRSGHSASMNEIPNRTKVSFILNLPRTEFSVQIDNESAIVLFSDIRKRNDIDYQFFLQLQETHDSVTLLDFIIS